MIIMLKILLVILTVLSFFGLKFGVKEYKIWKKSEETQELSVFEKGMVNLVALISGLVLMFMLIFSILFLFSKITLILPL